MISMRHSFNPHWNYGEWHFDMDWYAVDVTRERLSFRLSARA